MTHRLLSLIVPPAVLNISHKVLRGAQTSSVKRKLKGEKKLHLGCGLKVLNGWANIDFQSDGAVIGFDLTDRLPIDSNTIDLIYSEHFIEHLTLSQATALLSECHRVLRTGGMFRLSTPGLRKLIDEYLAGRTSEWEDVGWSPATPCQMVNEGLRLWGHQFVYDAAELQRILEEAGFSRINTAAWGESATPAFRQLESRPFHGEIIFEALK